MDEFWAYGGRKKNRKWLIYACHRESGEIVAYAWGKRDLKTARRLRRRLDEHGVSYGRIAHDEWDSFVSAFTGVATSCGKRYTQGIEGSNCRLCPALGAGSTSQRFRISWEEIPHEKEAH